MTTVEPGTVLDSGWTVRGIAQPNADCGGDLQDSAAYVTTFTKPIGGGLYAQVGVSCYLALYEEGMTRTFGCEDIPDLRVMQLQIEFRVVTDLDDPDGGDEEWWAYSYVDYQLEDPDGAGDADAEAKARGMVDDPVTDEEWNSFLDDRNASEDYWIV